MKNKIKKFLLCFSILGMLFTSLPSSYHEVRANEVQQSQVSQEVQESNVEENTTSLESPVESIGGGLQYVEQIDNTNLTRGSPTITSMRVLDYGTGEYIYAVGFNAITVQSNGKRYNRLLSEMLLNGDLVFCIEPIILTDIGVPYEVTTSDNYLTSVEKINLGLIGYFGYGYNGDTSDAMMAATQAMIWKYRGYGLADYKSELQSKMNIIQHRMDTFTIRPSFEGQSLEFEGYGKSNAITLKDTNNVLADFHIYDDGGYKLEKNGNTLKIWVEKGSKPAGTITLDRMNRDRIGNTVVWRNPDGKQTLANVKWSDPSSMKVKLRVAVGNIEITKKDDLGQAIKGTQFKVSSSADMSNMLGTYTTDSDGKIRIDDIPIKYNTLYYQEVFVPNPYAVDTTIRSIDVKYDTTTSAEVINQHQKGTITIHKEDSETGTTPQGDASLSGWIFGLYADKDKKVKIQDLVGTGNTATTDLLDVNKTYYIYEETVPIGYNPNKEPIKVTINYSNQNVTVNKHTAVLKDDVIKGNISIHKIVNKEVLFSLLRSSIKQPLENVHFVITHDKTGKKVDEMITDKNGYSKSMDLPYGWYTVSEQAVNGYETLAPFKVFIDKQGKVYNYYIENTAIVTKLRIVKKDAETNKVIPLAGTQFKIYDSKGNPVKQHLIYPIPMEIDTYITGKDGTVTLPEALTVGNYTLVEIKSPNSYLLNKDPIPFTVLEKNQVSLLEVECKDTPAKGTVTIEKQGEQFVASDFIATEVGVMYSPIYKMQNLEGVVFDIIAVEDIITKDGTLRYEKGKVVDTIKTGKSGKATSKPLYLGKYKIVEKSTLNGFLLDKTNYPFELEYKDQNTDLVTTSMRIENIRQKAKVLLVKKAETEEKQIYNPYSDIQFGLYARENILTAGGDIGIEKGSFIEAISLDELGNGNINTDLPAGSYTIKEIATGKGYLLTDTAYDFDFKYMGQEAPYIPIHVNDGKPIINKLMRGNLEITKISEDKKIDGISFKVSGTTEIGTTFEEIYKTDKNGKISIENLLVGTYEISEVMDDLTVGYITPENQTVTIKHSETSEIKMENKPIHGGFKLLKTDEDKKPLAGVKFGLYKADSTQITEFTTGEDGTYSMNDLLYGDYYLKELETVKGYEFDKEAVYAFSVSKDGEIIEITAVNKKIPEKPVIKTDTPKTGDNSNATAFLVLLGMSGISLAGISFIQYRKKKKAE